MSTQTFTCPICGGQGNALVTSMAYIGTLWEGACTNLNCVGVEPTEILSHEGDVFPVDEWEENYDKF